MDELERKAEHRLLALDATNKIQEATGLDDKWKGLVENSIYMLIEDGYRRGTAYPPKQNASSIQCEEYDWRKDPTKNFGNGY